MIVMYERLKPHDKAVIGPGNSTIDQTFTLCQILEMRYENQDRTQRLFVDFKAVVDSPVRDRVYAVMSELGIPTK